MIWCNLCQQAPATVEVAIALDDIGNVKMDVCKTCFDRDIECVGPNQPLDTVNYA